MLHQVLSYRSFESSTWSMKENDVAERSPLPRRRVCVVSGELIHATAETRMATRKGIHLNCNKTSGRVDLEFVLTLSLAVRLIYGMRGVRIVVGRLRLEKLSWRTNDVAIHWKFHFS